MNNELFKKLIESLSLTNIQPLKIEFERKGIFPTENSEINIGWKISYPNESFKIEQNFLKLYPMFEVDFIFNNEIIYSHKSIFTIHIQNLFAIHTQNKCLLTLKPNNGLN